jgi:hypothetical protein
VTLSVALRLVPLYVPVIVHVVVIRTRPVLTVKLALVAPAGMVTLPGAEHAPLLSVIVTTAPPAGAGPFSVSVPVELPSSPTTLLGFRLSEVSTACSTVSVAVRVAPP